MSDYYNILTNLGRSKITDLITSDTALENIQIAFGDGNGSVPTPNPARTALVNEVHRRPANKLQKHPTLTNSIIVDVVIPNNVGGFWIREFGIYFDGVLICNGSLAPTFKEASDDTVNTYRLKPYINVESDRLKVVEIESDLINATESWTQENFINRSEIIDNLTTNDADKVASARTVQELEDKKLNKTDLVNDLTSGGSKKILSAEMGKELQNKKLEKIFAGSIPVDVTSLRTSGVTYTNPSSKYYLQVCISGYRSGTGLVDFILNGNKFGSIGQSTNVALTTNITVLVPPLGEYSINNQLTGMYWSEM